MPFPYTVFFVQTYTTNINIRNIFPDLSDRRAVEFDFSRNTSISWYAEKVSDSASEKHTVKNASITVEAVICIPFFFYAALCLIWMLEIRTIQSVIRCGMQETGKKLAESAYESDILISSQMENMLVTLFALKYGKYLSGCLTSSNVGHLLHKPAALLHDPLFFV